MKVNKETKNDQNNGITCNFDLFLDLIQLFLKHSLLIDVYFRFICFDVCVLEKKHISLTEPPDNVTSGCHLLFLSNRSKFSANIKLPEQTVRAAEPLALVIDGLQLSLYCWFGKKMTNTMRIIAITRLTANNSTHMAFSMFFLICCRSFFLYFSLYHMKYIQINERIFSVCDTHWTDAYKVYVEF